MGPVVKLPEIHGNCCSMNPTDKLAHMLNSHPTLNCRMNLTGVPAILILRPLFAARKMSKLFQVLVHFPVSLAEKETGLRAYNQTIVFVIRQNVRD